MLRGHALFGMAFAGCQLAMAAYLVVYLWRELSLAPETAGLVFAVAHGSGVAARIVFGLVAGRWISSRTILSLLGAVMAAGLASLALSDAAWPIAAFYLTAIVIGISGNGWVGLFFSELAILAPEGRTADAAAGSQFYMYAGIVAGPLLGGAIIAATGSYAAAFATLAAIALIAGIGLYRLPK